MPLVLKNGKSYNDNIGNTYNALYAVIDYVSSDKYIKAAEIVVNIFKDSNSQNNRKIPVNSINYHITDPAFTTYFAPVAYPANGNPWKQAYIYISTLPEWADWEVG